LFVEQRAAIADEQYLPAFFLEQLPDRRTYFWTRRLAGPAAGVCALRIAVLALTARFPPNPRWAGQSSVPRREA